MTLPVLAYQHGVYPRSEDLVRATRDLDRGRASAEEADRVAEADREAFVELQRQAGLDLLSDGLLRWQDLFRPLVEGSDGMQARVLLRWFNNNAFFRAPQPEGSFRLRALPEYVRRNGIPEPRVASLPSPYLFSRAAQFAGDRDALMGALATEVLAPAIRSLREAGFGLFHLEEPWLVYVGIEDASWPPFEAALAEVRAAAGDATLVLHTYYGDAAPHADRLRRLPVDAVGVDFDETDADELPSPWGTGLLAGVLDGRRSVIESAGDVAAFVVDVVERLQPDRLLLSSGSDLELAGPQVAPRKVGVLGEAARLVKERL